MCFGSRENIFRSRDFIKCEEMNPGNQTPTDGGYTISRASIDDLAGILSIIRPLEKTGALVKRSKQRMEEDIDFFLVAKQGESIIGCCAVFHHDDMAELACIAVHSDFRGNDHVKNIGTALLSASEETARKQGSNTLFVLTTQAREWFLAKGFSDSSLEDLPTQKKELYNWQRQSQILSKSLT